MQDPKHRGKSTPVWLNHKRFFVFVLIYILEWPSQSSFFNHIEALWRDLKQAVQAKHPKIIHKLKQVCIKDHAKIPPNCGGGMISSYRKAFG